MKKITIAIDGFSSCGKSTIARDLAKRLGYEYIDTGAMYRALTLYLLDNGILKETGEFVYDVKDFLGEASLKFEINPENGQSEILLNGKNVEVNIRNMRVSKVVSKVSALKEVRDKLVAQQTLMGEDKGVVMDGRDIGTVVFPNAELKLFMTADTDVRSQRRFDELRGKGQEISLEKVKQNLEERDHLDTTREESPLVRAEDAIILDNSNLDLEEQLSYAVHLAKAEVFALNNQDLLD
jgi:cytidylate kinase